MLQTHGAGVQKGPQNPEIHSQWVKGSALRPETGMTERTNCCKVSSDLHRHTKACMHIHVSKQRSKHTMSWAWVDLLCKEK